MAFWQSSIWDFFIYRPGRNWLTDTGFRTEEVELPTPDRTRLICLYIYTSLVPKKGVIFLLHGRSGNASVYAQYAKPLVREGFDIFIAGWRGFGKSQGCPNHKNVIADSILALEYFLLREDVKHCKKVLWGLSLGGQVAIHLARKFPGCFDALVTEGAVASFEQAIKDYCPGTAGKIFKQFVSAPYSAAEDIKWIKDLPKLIIHSRDDKSITCKNADILFENAQEPKHRLTIEGAHLQGLNRRNGPVYLKAFTAVLDSAENKIAGSLK